MSEFDQYVDDYKVMLDESLGLLGKSNDYYLLQKINFLKNATQQINILSIMDFGCGLGGATCMLKNAFFETRVVGADISELSLEKAREHYASIEFGCTTDKKFIDSCVGAFDIIYVANVFHHILPSDRNSVMESLKFMLREGGKVFLFEHNPLNPLTKWVVSRCKFDKNAILLSPKESRFLFKKAGFKIVDTKYLIFFPYKLRCFSKFEIFLGWLPFGAQYCMTATK
jgi:SAM-dependent methyltransferase